MVMKVDEALRLLEITPPVTIEQIKKQYRKMAMRYSPDITRDPTTEHLFRLIIVAHEFLLKNFEMFFGNKFKTCSAPKTKPAPKNPPATPTRKWRTGGEDVVLMDGLWKLWFEKFNNGKSIRDLMLNRHSGKFVYKQAQESFKEFLDTERDEYEWFARIYGCGNIERDFLISCDFSPWFPHDDPPRVTYLHRDLL